MPVEKVRVFFGESKIKNFLIDLKPPKEAVQRPLLLGPEKPLFDLCFKRFHLLKDFDTDRFVKPDIFQIFLEIPGFGEILNLGDQV